MNIDDELFRAAQEVAMLRQLEWVNQCCRQVDPRDLCYCELFTFAHRPLFWQFVCRGVVISQFEIVCPGID